MGIVCARSRCYAGVGGYEQNIEGEQIDFRTILPRAIRIDSVGLSRVFGGRALPTSGAAEIAGVGVPRAITRSSHGW